MNWNASLSLVILAGCLLTGGKAAAQDIHQQKVDSLQSLLNGPQKEDGLLRASSLLELGKMYMIKSDYVAAARSYTKSLEIAEKLHNDSLVAQYYHHISIVYFYQQNYKESIATDSQAIRIFERLHLTQMMAYELHSLGDTYLKMGDSLLAESYYNKALPIFEAGKEWRGMAALYANLSILTHGDIRRAIAMRLKARALWDKYPVDNVLPIINVGNLGEGYLDLVRYDGWQALPPSDTLPHDRLKLLALGERYLREAIRIGHAAGDVVDSAYFTGVLAELEEQKGDYRHAYTDFRAYQNITDSVYSQENKNKIAAIENERAIDRKNQEISTKELQIANQHKKMWILASFVALLAVTGGLLYRQGLQRKKNNAVLRRLNMDLDAANKVKARFFGILTHDLRSPVARLVHFLQLQEMEPGIMTAGEEAEQKVRMRTSAQALLDTMETVLLWSKGQMERFQPEMSPVAVRDLFSELERLYPANEGIAYTFQDEDCLTVETDRHYLRSILYNLTANATRAVAAVPHPAIEWRAWQQSGKIRLAISDNGPGISNRLQLTALFEESAIGSADRGLGLHIIRDLAKAINCQVEAEALPGRGMRFVLQFAAATASRASSAFVHK